MHCGKKGRAGKLRAVTPESPMPAGGKPYSGSMFGGMPAKPAKKAAKPKPKGKAKGKAKPMK
jgi:hypothetical protein